MNTVKQAVLEVIQSLPETCTFDDVHYHLRVREKIERGQEDIDRGDYLSQEETEREMKQWLKSIGRDKPETP